jgi:hypothetical protein
MRGRASTINKRQPMLAFLRRWFRLVIDQRRYHKMGDGDLRRSRWQWHDQ